MFSKMYLFAATDCNEASESSGYSAGIVELELATGGRTKLCAQTTAGRQFNLEGNMATRRTISSKTGIIMSMVLEWQVKYN